MLNRNVCINLPCQNTVTTSNLTKMEYLHHPFLHLNRTPSINTPPLFHAIESALNTSSLSLIYEPRNVRWKPRERIICPLWPFCSLCLLCPEINYDPEADLDDSVCMNEQFVTEMIWYEWSSSVAVFFNITSIKFCRCLTSKSSAFRL